VFSHMPTLRTRLKFLFFSLLAELEMIRVSKGAPLWRDNTVQPLATE
jgi:hypothetical protein